MQIHELTQKKTIEQVDEGLGSAIGSAVGKGVGAVKKVGTAVASPFRDAAAGYRSGKVDSKTSSIADKAYRAWSAYRQQLDKAAPGGKADPATLQKQLLAFVQKNLLGQKQFSTLINKDQILGVVKQIARGPVQTGGAGAFGQMAQQLTKEPEVGTQAASSTGGTTTKTATGQVHTAKKAPAAGVRTGKVPSTPGGKPPKVSPAPKAGGPTPAEQAKFQQMIQQATSKGQIKEDATTQELELFKKLVTLVAQAEQEVSTKAPAQPAITPTTGNIARSTGNPTADQLLAQSGYKVQA